MPFIVAVFMLLMSACTHSKPEITGQFPPTISHGEAIGVVVVSVQSEGLPEISPDNWLVTEGDAREIEACVAYAIHRNNEYVPVVFGKEVWDDLFQNKRKDELPKSISAFKSHIMNRESASKRNIRHVAALEVESTAAGYRSRSNWICLGDSIGYEQKEEWDTSNAIKVSFIDLKDGSELNAQLSYSGRESRGLRCLGAIYCFGCIFPVADTAPKVTETCDALGAEIGVRLRNQEEGPIKLRYRRR